tara:strand:- start:14348 stop:14653 length:306 start_codon:yes stop_codon:yes gene_type:complete
LNKELKIENKQQDQININNLKLEIMAKVVKYEGGGGFTYGAGDGDITPQKANMESMAKGGGLMGYMNGGGVMDNMMDKMGKGGAKKGDQSKSRLDYMGRRK